jgi:methylglyoxal synthase
LLKSARPAKGGNKPHGTQYLPDGTAKEDSPPRPRQHQDRLVQWAKDNKERLANHELFATGSTGEQLEDELGFNVHTLLHGPLGGDLQIGGKISEGDIDFLIFFLDPLTPVSHDTDVQALMRMAVLWNIPVACNRASADFMITSALMDQEYQRLLTEEIDTYGSR